MLESHCCKCVALNMYVSVSLAPCARVCRCGCHIICSAAFTPNLLLLQVSKHNGDAQGHMTASKGTNQLCDAELFGSLCLPPRITGNVIGSRIAGIQTTEKYSWFRSPIAAAAAVEIVFDILFERLLSSAKHKLPFGETL